MPCMRRCNVSHNFKFRWPFIFNCTKRSLHNFFLLLLSLPFLIVQCLFWNVVAKPLLVHFTERQYGILKLKNVQDILNRHRYVSKSSSVWNKKSPNPQMRSIAFVYIFTLISNVAVYVTRNDLSIVMCHEASETAVNREAPAGLFKFNSLGIKYVHWALDKSSWFDSLGSTPFLPIKALRLSALQLSSALWNG